VSLTQLIVIYQSQSLLGYPKKELYQELADQRLSSSCSTKKFEPVAEKQFFKAT
jgi:hypothetical protein